MSLKKSFRLIVLSISIFIIITFGIFIINQSVEIVKFADILHPLFGTLIAWLLLVLYLILILVPAFLYLRLPKTLIPPSQINSEEYTLFLEKLSKRLRSNDYLKNQKIETRQDIEAALKILDDRARTTTKKHATIIFISTAISQSGRLDAFTVLFTQIRMVWQIAHIYYHRPTIREMIHLYSNVAATAFIASELNEVDVSQQIEPIVSSVLGASVTGSIPGVNLVAGIVTNSLITGSANAYLTLRVGIITQKFCGGLLKEERGFIRKSATIEAARLLSIIVMNSASNISRAIVNAAVRRPGKFSRDFVSSTWKRIKGKEKPASDIFNDG
jgi:hypothetical protein